jgi:N-acetylmuramoyl-L-alanine amidase CwlA
MIFKEFDKGLIFKRNLLNVQKIVIHNSASAGDAYSAANYNYTQTKIKNANTGFAHYYVDDKQVIMLARESWETWHSGKADMNRVSIGIEICCNPMACLNKCTSKTCLVAPSELCKSQKKNIERFFKAEENAQDLVYMLLTKYGLTKDDVIFHSEVKNTACPYFTKKLHNITHGNEFLQILQ